MSEKNFHFTKKLGFILEKLEQVNNKIELVIKQLHDKGLTDYELDLLNETKIILTNLEFHNNIDENLGRTSIDDFIERTNSLINVIREIVYDDSDNYSYIPDAFEKYKSMYKAAHDDFTMGLGKMPN